MIALYNRADCPFCWKVRFGLVTAGLDFETVDVRLGEKHPDVVRYNPKGSVPVLVDGETVIWESSAILEYLDDKYAQGVLFPGSAERRAKVRLLHSYSDTLVGAALREIVFEKRSKPEHQWDKEKIYKGEAAWRDCLRQLSVWLDGSDYFCESFSAAECALLSRFGIAEAYGVPGIDEFPLLKRWFGELKQTPSYVESYPNSFIRCSDSL